MKISLSRCLICTMANRMDDQNSLRRLTRREFVTSAMAISRRFGSKMDGWEQAFANKVWAQPWVKTKYLRDPAASLLTELLGKAFPRIASYYGEVTAIDFTMLPFVREGTGGKIYLSLALDVWGRRVRQHILHLRCPTAVDSIRLLEGIEGQALVCVRSDWGSIYRAHSFRRYLHNSGIDHCLIPKGAPMFNGHIEVFFRNLKTQLDAWPDPITDFESLAEAISQIIDTYHETIHSSLGTKPLL
jgi:transposase InsO family protein